MEEKKFDVLQIFQLIFAILLLLISIYSFFTENSNILPVMFILMSIVFFIIGLREYKRTRNLVWGIFYLCTSLSILFVAVKSL